MSNVYQAPEANLIKDNEQAGGYGSVEKAVSGDYEFSIGGVLSEAWEKTSGCKWQFILANIFYFLVFIGLTMVVSMIVAGLVTTTAPEQGTNVMTFVPFLLQMGTNFFMMPIIAGLFVMGIRRSMGVPVNATSVFSHFSKILPLFATSFLMILMIIIGMFLLVLPGIYLMFAYYMAMPLVVEKGMSPWQALETSRKAVTKRWFSVAGLFIVLSIIVFISMLPLGIGLIWTAPMFMVAYGILYRNMFGVEAETLE